jgi:hypothetical protein
MLFRCNLLDLMSFGRKNETLGNCRAAKQVFCEHGVGSWGKIVGRPLGNSISSRLAQTRSLFPAPSSCPIAEFTILKFLQPLHDDFALFRRPTD